MDAEEYKQHQKILYLKRRRARDKEYRRTHKIATIVHLHRNVWRYLDKIRKKRQEDLLCPMSDRSMNAIVKELIKFKIAHQHCELKKI